MFSLFDDEDDKFCGAAAVIKFSRKATQECNKINSSWRYQALWRNIWCHDHLAPGICWPWIRVLAVWLPHTKLNLENCAASPPSCPTQVQFVKFCPSRQGYQIYLHILQSPQRLGDPLTPPAQWVVGSSSGGKSASNLYLVKRLKMSGSAPSRPYIPSWWAQTQHFNILCRPCGRNQK